MVGRRDERKDRMKRALVIACALASPLVTLVAGAALVLSPEVLTTVTTVEVRSSHEVGLALLALGGFFTFISAIVVMAVTHD